MAATGKGTRGLESDPLWYKDAIIYELHVRAFHDSNGDGIGDFQGLTAKLDYLNDLGITAIWLLPFYPSPLKDDGYDIADYTNVHPAYGTLADFRHFLREAHDRGMRVITELILNHTSDQHPWFQRARRAPPGSKWRNFYVWNDSSDKYPEARIIFKDFESSNWTWDPVAGAYYWHRFYSHQPDLNFDNPAVRKAVFQVLDFWLNLGVDGLRLDAVPYLFERDGTNCENLPETHKVLKALRKRVDEKYQDRMLLAEANQWPEDAVAYFGSGDECHMAFHFPLMPRMFMALRMEDRYPIIDILTQTPEIPDVCQWALFLRNHDELTLEMVTDEERDYMYRVYAADPQARINLGIRRRLVPLLGKSRRKFELMNALLCSLPGTPVVYYGDEIGMGDNMYLGDRNGVRTPMQWNADRNAGFSGAPAQRLYFPVIIDPEYHYQTVNVEASQNNPSSDLWWMKRLISLRKQYRAFGRGSTEFLYPENHKVLVFIRSYEDEAILVVANLSRFSNYVEIDLSKFKGRVPIELFGQTEFPAIKEEPYFLTLGPHAFHWFHIGPEQESSDEVGLGRPESEIPHLAVTGSWEEMFAKKNKRALQAVLPAFLATRRWFGGKARRLKSTEFVDAISLRQAALPSRLALIRVEYTEGDPELYCIILAFAAEERAAEILSGSPGVIMARLSVSGRNGSEEGVVFDALADPGTRTYLLDAIARRRKFKGATGELLGVPSSWLKRLLPIDREEIPTTLMKAEQSNTSVVFGDQFIFKLFRRVDEGINPDVEIGTYLTTKSFPHAPRVLGSLVARRGREEPVTLAVLQEFVTNQGDAWQYTLDNLGRYFERVMARRLDLGEPPCAESLPFDGVGPAIPPVAAEMIGEYLQTARLLGERTADLHVTLASNLLDPAFAPEPFSTLHQRSLYQSMRNLTGQTLILLQKRLRHLPEEVRGAARQVLGLESAILARFHVILERKITAARIRVHGDYHLGQVLYTGRDFMIIDFEGEPAHSLSARRIKRSPLRDIAGMLRSFDYASNAPLIGMMGGGVFREEDAASLVPWARCWSSWVSVEFLKQYIQTSQKGGYLPKTSEETAALLNAYLLEKAIYELAYELNNRPQWVKLPLHGVLKLVEGG